jgi:hypothetical protein
MRSGVDETQRQGENGVGILSEVKILENGHCLGLWYIYIWICMMIGNRE